MENQEKWEMFQSSKLKFFHFADWHGMDEKIFFYIRDQFKIFFSVREKLKRFFIKKL